MRLQVSVTEAIIIDHYLIVDKYYQTHHCLVDHTYFCNMISKLILSNLIIIELNRVPDVPWFLDFNAQNIVPDFPKYLQICTSLL